MVQIWDLRRLVASEISEWTVTPVFLGGCEDGSNVLLFLWFCLWLDDLTLQPLVGHAGCVHATVQCLCVVTDTVR